MTITKLFTIYAVFTLKDSLIFTRSMETEKLKTNKINECLRCKVLTDSFNSWLDKTSRGKHEGGDAAWEEAKMKLYARSEMRLVEIQEGLCSELKTYRDQCYALSEEAEQVLENWWFNENNYNSDLYTWLCIENLQYCCPQNHYGEICTPCPLGKNNKVCGGKGKCDGDGTRKGNGTCICRRGHSGSYCEECAKNFYNTNNVCKSCHQACNECHSEGPNSCLQCSPGWIMNSEVCTDVNECLDLSICSSNEFCINREGSYTCNACDRTCKTCTGSGPKNCTFCAPDNILWGGRCLNYDHYKYFLKNAFARVVFYLCLCILVIVIFKKSWSLASVVVLVTSLVIYFFEGMSDIKLIDFYKQYY